jgi:hypothetical protein
VCPVGSDEVARAQALFAPLASEGDRHAT